LPYAPFDFNSGMDLRPVSRAECVALGVMLPNRAIQPQRRSFEDDTKASAKGLSDEMERVLVESLGAGWEMVDGVLYKANEARIGQLRNEILISELI